jgi:hypothetical protein
LEIDADGLIRGVGQDEDSGTFDIIGALAGTDFLFNKTYRGKATASYYDKVKDNFWAGKWSDSNDEGEFMLVPKFQSWKGHIFQDGVSNTMHIDRLFVGRSVVKGSGSEVNASPTSNDSGMAISCPLRRPTLPVEILSSMLD